MTNKRVIIVLSILAVVAILMLVSSLVFKIKTIDVIFLDTEVETVFTSDEVKDASKIKMGGSIFLVGKNKAINNIEKAIPTAKVEKITSKFPNKIIISVKNRIEEFYVKFENDVERKFLVCDSDLKILRETTEEPQGLCELKINPSSTDIAAFLDNGFMLEIISIFESYTFDANKVKEYFKNINKTETDLIITTNINTTITIKNIADEKNGKIQTALSIFWKSGEIYKESFEVTKPIN